MRMGTRALTVVVAVALLGPLWISGAQPVGSEEAVDTGGTGEFVVFYGDGADSADVHAAVTAAGGTVQDEITELGIARVTTNNAGFSAAVTRSGAVRSVVRNHAVGFDRQGMVHRFADERVVGDRATYGSAAGRGPAAAARTPKVKHPAGTEPLSARQWDMQMIGATPDGAHQTATGDGVLVGIIDTGIDGSHPDLAPNFHAALSQNFTTDIPAIDGPCEVPSCQDPANIDDGGHGTHVAGIVAAAVNNFGIAGVAPDATLVNIRAGQDSGFFFFFETVAALMYAADNGIDVVNMSFFTDPWLFNCESAADYVEGEPTAEEIAQQAEIRAGLLEATAYAHDHGVTMVAAAGNDHFDLAAPVRHDTISPDYPVDTEQDRLVTNNCLDLPSEAPNVVQVSAIGPSTVKSDYSVWGMPGIDVAAPGGWYRDYFGTSDFRRARNMILSTYPLHVAIEEGGVTPSGGLKDPHFYRKDCHRGVCGYYQYLQGTSMASPHVAGVVALIIQAHGTPDGAGGYDLDPDTVYSILTNTATDTSCPDPALLDYTDEGRPADWNATCIGTPDVNSNYGEGIVNADAAVD